VPRKPTDKVIEHRIVFGNVERKLLDQLAFSLTIKNIATPAVSLMKDVTGMVVLVYGLNKMFDLNIDIGGVTDIDQLVNAVDSGYQFTKRQREEFQETPDNPINAKLGIFGKIFELIGDVQRGVLFGDPDGPEFSGRYGN